MADKTNYRTPQPDKEANGELVAISHRLDTIKINHEIKGWWIWITSSGLSTEQVNNLVSYGFFQAANGRNAGKWYYKHPRSPKSYRRGRRGNSNTKSKPKSNPVQTHGDKKLSKLEMLELKLKGLEDLLFKDSGENHLNIAKMIAEVKHEISVLKGIDMVKDAAQQESKPKPLQEFIDEHKQEPEPESSEDKTDDMSEDEAMDILGDLFGN